MHTFIAITVFAVNIVRDVFPLENTDMEIFSFKIKEIESLVTNKQTNNRKKLN